MDGWMEVKSEILSFYIFTKSYQEYLAPSLASCETRGCNFYYLLAIVALLHQYKTKKADIIH